MALKPLYDRVLAVNMVGTLTVLTVAVLGFMTDRPEFLDIALVYVLISFVSTIAVLRVYAHHSGKPAEHASQREKQS